MILLLAVTPWLFSQLCILFLPILVSTQFGLISMALRYSSMDPQYANVLSLLYFFYQLSCLTIVLIFQIDATPTVSNFPSLRFPSYMSI